MTFNHQSVNQCSIKLSNIKYIILKRFGNNFWLYDHSMRFLGIHTYDYETRTFVNKFDPLDQPDAE